MSDHEYPAIAAQFLDEFVENRLPKITTTDQLETFKAFWATVRGTVPLPTVTVYPSHDDVLEVAWNPKDGPSFDITINRDGTLEWFFCDGVSAGTAEGTEDEDEPRRDMPPRGYELLARIERGDGNV